MKRNKEKGKNRMDKERKMEWIEQGKRKRSNQEGCKIKRKESRKLARKEKDNPGKEKRKIKGWKGREKWKDRKKKTMKEKHKNVIFLFCFSLELISFRNGFQIHWNQCFSLHKDENDNNASVFLIGHKVEKKNKKKALPLLSYSPSCNTTDTSLVRH